MIIRKTNKDDKEQIIQFLESLDEKDKKFLALKPKLAFIKQAISKGTHCYVAEEKGKIIAFARESGRPNGFVVLEEIVVSPYKRGKGVSARLLSFLLSEFPKMETKTFSNNKPMKNLLKNLDFEARKTSLSGKITYWIKK